MVLTMSQSAWTAQVAFEYAITPVLLAYYLVTTFFLNHGSGHEDKLHFSKKRRIILVTSSCLVSTSYLAQALQLLRISDPTPDGPILHALSQALLWATLSLILAETSYPIPVVYIGLSSVNIVLESVILTLDLAKVFQRTQIHHFETFRIVTLAALVSFTVLAILFLLDRREVTGTNQETQSLLDQPSPTSTNPPSTVSCYETLHNQEVGSAVEEDKDRSDDGDDDDDEKDDDEDDEHVPAALKKRLEETGGWLEYLKTFKLFLPFVIPRGNFRLQVYLVWMMINILIQRVLNVLHPRQLGIVTNILLHEHRVPWSALLLWAFYGAAASDCVGLGAANEMLQHRLDTWTRQKLVNAALSHVMELSMDFHDQKDSGEVIKAIEQASAVCSLTETIIHNLLPATLDIAVAVIYITYLFDAYALLILLTVIVAFLFSTYKITLFATFARRIVSLRERQESKMIYEAVSNWFSVISMNRKHYTLSRLSGTIKNAADSNLRSNDITTYMFGVQEAIERLGLTTIMILAIYRVVKGVSSVGDVITIQGYWGYLVLPLWMMSSSYRHVNRNLVSAERLLQILNEKPSIQEHSSAHHLTNVHGDVRLENVQFRYPNRDIALPDFNLHVPAGRMVALVGETGGGKSTIFKLLMRFYDVTSGTITIDNHDIRNLTLDSLRDCFGFVPQDPVLFNTTILENVRYSNIDASDAAVYDACRAASIHDKILTFPRGYASKVGERGVRLSGGERQRIALARVFLKNPQIVLLDEATSAMDSQTEARIQDALKRLIKGRTTFVIAHRLSTIVEADSILVIEKGEVVEKGSHAELLDSKGKYAELWNRQAFVQAPL